MVRMANISVRKYFKANCLIINGPLSTRRFLSVANKWRRFSRNLVKYSSTLFFSLPSNTAESRKTETKCIIVGTIVNAVEQFNNEGLHLNDL